MRIVVQHAIADPAWRPSVLVTTICGDDPSAASETPAAFGEQVVGTLHDEIYASYL
jgi:hypothetical protein